MYKSLTDYIAFLEQKGELARIKAFVDPVLEIAEITDRVSKQPGGGKALLFENTGTGFPILTNAFGSEQRMCNALGISNLDAVGDQINTLFKQVTTPKISLWEKLRLLPTLKQAASWMPRHLKSRGACQEVVMNHPDLSHLPILQCWPFDGGRFVTLPMVHTTDPYTGMRNVGMYRMQVFDNVTTGMHWHRHKTGARHYAGYKKIGKRMPIAVTLGGDPAYAYSATSPLPDNVDEYLFAGFLRKKSVRLVKCLTQDVEVPEDVDIVIEGYVDPVEPLRAEGPFGDHTGFYSLEDFYPVFHITCITHRKGAVYPATIVGIPPQEDAYIGKATERIFVDPIKLVISPEIIDMDMPFAGVAHNLIIVKIDKTYPGQAIKVANALWGAGQMMFVKIIVVVDGETNVHNYSQVLNTLAENYTPTRDTYLSSGPLDILDHAAQQPGFGGKLCLDATAKLPEELQTEATHSIEGQSAYQFVHKSNFNLAEVGAKITVVFDDKVDIVDKATCIWLLGNNIDPARDCTKSDKGLVINACTKRRGEEGFNRPWPNVVCASTTTIETINHKWMNLGIGEFIPSPSLKYKKLEEGSGAVVSP